jgi:hypothetical protein
MSRLERRMLAGKQMLAASRRRSARPLPSFNQTFGALYSSIRRDVKLRRAWMGALGGQPETSHGISPSAGSQRLNPSLDRSVQAR